MYFAETDTHEYRFATEDARDGWVSCFPHSRKMIDPPADTSGFRPSGMTECRPREEKFEQQVLAFPPEVTQPVFLSQEEKRRVWIALDSELPLLGRVEAEKIRTLMSKFAS